MPSSIANLVLGLGVLTIGGTTVGWLDGDVSYSGVADIGEALKSSTNGGPQFVVARYHKKLGAVLKASVAEITSTNANYFLLNGTVTQVLPQYNIVFTHTKQVSGSVVISMTCNIIPTGEIKFNKSTITLLGVEFRLVGSSMPSISIT